MNYEQAIDYIEQTDTPARDTGWKKIKTGIASGWVTCRRRCPMSTLRAPTAKAPLPRCFLRCSTARVCAADCTPPPHLQRYNERFQIAGEPISDEQLIQSVQRVQQVCEHLGGTPIVFEVLTLMAFELFVRLDCQIAVLEVGIGGRLDATNCIPSPQAAVVTQLGLDHTETLGTPSSRLHGRRAVSPNPAAAW